MRRFRFQYCLIRPARAMRFFGYSDRMLELAFVAGAAVLGFGLPIGLIWCLWGFVAALFGLDED